MKKIPYKVLTIGIAALLAAGINTSIYAEEHDVDPEAVETTEAEHTEATLGVGEQTIAQALSEAMVAADDTGETDIDTASATVMDMRESGMGWGQIANELGFKLGDVVSDFHSSRDSLPENASGKAVENRAARLERSNRPEKMSRPEKMEHVDRPERVERAERPERPDRPGRS
jgi:hypothetical protein